MANLSLRDATKTFNDDGDEIVAVDNLNLEIEDGEFLVLVLQRARERIESISGVLATLSAITIAPEPSSRNKQFYIT
jgi:energy-coupling factor transporter ATP-binding protein EcfA2